MYNVSWNKPLTPAVVRQEVNFLESSESSLQRTTVNLRTDNAKDAWIIEVRIKWQFRSFSEEEIHGDSLRQDAGLHAAARGEDHLSQFVEELDGSSRQLRQTPDGRGMNLLTGHNTHTHSWGGCGLKHPNIQYGISHLRWIDQLFYF